MSTKQTPTQPQTGMRSWADFNETNKKNEVPEGLWMSCPTCDAMLYKKQVQDNHQICSECQHHMRLGGRARVTQLVDHGTFEEKWADLHSVDALNFVDRISYPERLKKEQKKTGETDALISGHAYIKGRRVVLAVMNPDFMMASMGSVVGEKITRCIELAHKENLPFILVNASGGARMQESGLSLAQMAKTSAALARFDRAGGLFISILTDPTYGGVTASFAMLGDIIIAEPKAMIGFAGPRVIAGTVRQELPEGFQRAEFLQDNGFVDRVIPRLELRKELAKLIDFAGK